MQSHDAPSNSEHARPSVFHRLRHRLVGLVRNPVIRTVVVVLILLVVWVLGRAPAGNVAANGQADPFGSQMAVGTPISRLDVPTATPTDTPTNTPVPPTATPTDTPTNTPVAPTATPTDTPTNTPVPPTATPTDTPTATPTATPTPAIFMSALESGTTADGLAFGPEDIIRYNGTSWSMWFDGSAAGLMPNGRAKHNIDALWIPDPNGNEAILSFAQNRRLVPDIIQPVDGMDLVRWDGSAFSLWFDGSDVDLTNKTQEKIDALHVLPGSASPVGGSCQAYLLISTQGPGRVRAYDGAQLKFNGEDVLGFCMTNAGANTAGYWHMVLDGSAQGMPRNATDSISLSADGQTLYLTTQRTFNVDSATGGHSMAYAYNFATQTFSGPIFIAAAHGLPKKVDGLQMN